MSVPEHNNPPDDLPPHSPEFEALAALADAYLTHIGRDAALEYLSLLAGKIETTDERVVNLRDGASGVRAQRQARAWIRRNITLWLARHG